jgi:hypothetical protein
MSSFLADLSEKYRSNQEINDLVFDYFNRSSKPFDDLFECLLQLSSESDNQSNLINTLLQLFTQWKDQSLSVPKLNETKLNTFILQNLPFESLNNFIEIFQISKEYLINLFKSTILNPIDVNTYKRTIHLIAKLNYQFEFQPNELLLRLILNSKDYLIDIYLDKNRQYEEYLLEILNHLYERNGKKIGEILENDYQMKNETFHKRALSKLTVRYWNLYGNEQNEKYPNLAILQKKRTLSYLINIKYNTMNEEKTMSDECWNELVEVKMKRRRSIVKFFFVGFG